MATLNNDTIAFVGGEDIRMGVIVQAFVDNTRIFGEAMTSYPANAAAYTDNEILKLKSSFDSDLAGLLLSASEYADSKVASASDAMSGMIASMSTTANAYADASSSAVQSYCASELSTHITDDVGRWNAVYESTNNRINQLVQQLSDLQLSVQNKVADVENAKDLVEDIGSSGTWTCDAPLGGMLNGSAVVVLIGTSHAEIGGKSIFDTRGLALLSTPVFSENVYDGDVLTWTGLTSLTFTPYKTGAQA